MGIATTQDIADYFRMTARDVAPLIDGLVADGQLTQVEVESWREIAWLAATARIPRKIPGQSLLSPFDPVVWFRPRALRLFEFHYRIEIYVPASKRQWGYYVLPFRLGDQIVARVDLKADRHNSRLQVLAVHAEACAIQPECIEGLSQELRSLQRWLGLEAIQVARHNGISRRLADATRS
jgi:uncharacterized protein YcaQ